MAENNNQILTGRQQPNTIQQNKDNELDSQNNQSQSPAVIFGSKENNQKQDALELDSKQNDLEREKQKILKNL